MLKRRSVILGLSILLAIYAVGWFLLDCQAFLKKPLQLPEGGIHYYIPPGVSTQKIAEDLLQNKILTSKTYFLSYAFLTGNFNAIQYGEYYFPPDITAEQLFHKLSQGLILQRRLTLVEGWSFKQVLQAMQQAPFLKHTVEDETSLLRVLPLPYASPEGIFFPNTYFYYRNLADKVVLKKAYSLMQKHLEQLWIAREPDLPFQSSYEALILASIVEKEAKLDSERPMIAGVFIARLKKRMKLQADPTVIYGLGGNFNGNLQKDHLLLDTPFNTYLHFGLPPTPIALPGLLSMQAVMHPAKTTALYFVAKGDGSHYFSSTLAEHVAAVARYQLKKGKP